MRAPSVAVLVRLEFSLLLACTVNTIFVVILVCSFNVMVEVLHEFIEYGFCQPDVFLVF